MGRVHFVGGEKGGVGKSLTARLLAQYFIDSGAAVVGFDSDRSHGTFSRFYGEYTSPLRVDDYESLDAIIDAAEQRPDREIVVDLAAQTSSYLAKWITDSVVFEIFDELGYDIFFWHVMDDGFDSTQLLDEVLDRHHHERLSFVVVQNLGRALDFEGFRQSHACRRAVERHARFLTLNRLEPKLVQKIDFNSFSFWAGANNTAAMSIVERKRVGAWLRSHYAQLDGFLGRASTPQDTQSPAAQPVTGMDSSVDLTTK